MVELKMLAMNPAPRKRSITVERKREIIQKYEEGARILDIACELGRASSTIATILKKNQGNGCGQGRHHVHIKEKNGLKI